MNGYDIFLCSGDLLTTISEKTLDNRLGSSLVLIGQGVPDFWSANDQDFAWMLEHFSAAIPPRSPLTGQLWHNRGQDRLAVYNGTDWETINTQETSDDGLFEMLGTATDIDFTRTGSTPIFTVPDQTKEYLPTGLILVVNGTSTATHPAIINVSALEDGDILSSRSVPVDPNGGFYQVETNSLCRILSYTPVPSPYGLGSYGSGLFSQGIYTASTVWINVTTAASGGTLHYDAYLFGFVRDIGLTITRRGYGEGLYGEGIYD